MPLLQWTISNSAHPEIAGHDKYITNATSELCRDGLHVVGWQRRIHTQKFREHLAIDGCLEDHLTRENDPRTRVLQKTGIHICDGPGFAEVDGGYDILIIETLPVAFAPLFVAPDAVDEGFGASGRVLGCVFGIECDRPVIGPLDELGAGFGAPVAVRVHRDGTERCGIEDRKRPLVTWRKSRWG